MRIPALRFAISAWRDGVGRFTLTILTLAVQMRSRRRERLLNQPSFRCSSRCNLNACPRLPGYQGGRVATLEGSRARGLASGAGTTDVSRRGRPFGAWS
jgi:hypothetical protein